jgi:signal transduction histidine kinase
MKELLQEIDKIKQLTKSDRLTIWVRAYDDYKYILKPFYMDGIENDELDSNFLKIKLIDNDGNGQLVFDALKMGKPMILNEKSQEFINKIEGRLKYKLNTTMLLPLKTCNTTIGVIQLLNNKNGKYLFEDIKKVDTDIISKIVVDKCDFINFAGEIEVALTLFTMKAEYEVKTIWQFINMLKTIDDFDDTKEGRDNFRRNVFEVYNTKITSYISRFESNLHRLQQIALSKIAQIASYIEQTYGTPKKATLDKLKQTYDDLVITYEFLAKNPDSLKIYLDDYILEDNNEKKSILKIAQAAENIGEFYQKTKNALNIIRVDAIDTMLNDLGGEPFVDEFLGIVDDESEMASNVAILSKVNESLRQLIKFKKIMSGISYFGNNTGFYFYTRELSYFVDLFNIFKDERFENFFYNNQIFKNQININLTNNTKIKTDAFKLELALEAILNNASEELALKTIQDGEFQRVIDINISSDSDFAYIDIEDNGRGIKKEFLDKIYDKYITFGKYTGAGIGLTIAKDVVENGLKGSLICTIKDGKTKFTIKLPL